jgi:hypothetical protein
MLGYAASVFVPLQRMVLRARHVRSRADELVEVHGRLRAARSARSSDDERAAALELRDLKVRVADVLASVSSCGRCANGKPTPRGVFAGGDCCTGVTAELFSDNELAALAGGGTTPRDLRAPLTAHAGCAFRGATGCSLSPADRPERCVTYTCGTLRRELHERRDLASVEALLAELHATMERFLALRQERLDDDLFR